MAVDYIDPEIETDSEALAAGAYAVIQEQFPGWLPHEGNLEVILTQAYARMSSEARETASAVPKSIFRYFGATLMNVIPVDDAEAVVATVWTMQDDAGYTIPIDTQIGIRSAGDVLVAFLTMEEAIIMPGETVSGTVFAIAAEPGVHANGLSGDFELIDPLAFVDSVVSQGASGGGENAEEDEEYLRRLAEELTLLTPRPILANDFAILAQRVPGVGRATALDGYNPSNDTYNNERMVAVYITDTDGNAAPSGVKSDVDALLESLREVNFIVTVNDPTYTIVDVSFTCTTSLSYDPADVVSRAEEAIAEYFNPMEWGQPPTGDVRLWVNKTSVRLYELVTVVNNVEGVDEVNTLTIGINGGAQTAADHTLAGEVSLPDVGSIVGTAA